MPIQIVGLGAQLPEKVLTNDDLSEMVDTSDEWIFPRTGIRERRVAQKENIVSLGVQAAEQALQNAGMDRQEIELVICATLTPYLVTPQNASEIRKLLGIENAAAFDINVQCSGFIYGIAIARGLMETMGYKHALIIGSELLSKVTDWTERSTCVLYGDGAGAAVVSKTAEGCAGGVLQAYLEGVNDTDDSLRCYAVQNDSPFSQVEPLDVKMRMKGDKVFTFAVSAMIRCIQKVTAAHGICPEDVKWYVPHQANARIIHSTANRLRLDRERFFTNIGRTGNTSSASIPMALHALYGTGELKKGDLVVLVGFGGGLSAGAILMEW